MSLLENIRAKFGGKNDAAALARALTDTEGRINKNREEARALENDLPAAVISSADGGATERRKLERLQSEHDALVVTAGAIRRQIEEAQAAEEAADLQKEWAAAEQCGKAKIEAAIKVDAAAKVLAGALADLDAASNAFEVALPTRARDYSPTLQTSAISYAIDMVRNGRLSLPRLHSLQAIAQDEVIVALRVRPKPETTRGKAAA